ANANGRFPIGHLLVDLTGGVLSHLLVLGGFRDQGLGTALIVEGERVLRERGVMHATLVVEKANDGAIRLYERLGYTREGEADEMPGPRLWLTAGVLGLRERRCSTARRESTPLSRSPRR